MKKVSILAAAMLVAGAAFAAGPAATLDAGRMFVSPDETFDSGAPATTDNDGSCDIAVTPAATLLLPYFEVDTATANPTNSVNTLFAITNTSAVPQVAHVTIWTDWSFPVIDFNIFLTGYDVATVSLSDLIVRGTLPGGGYNSQDEGELSEDNITGRETWSPWGENFSRCAALAASVPQYLLVPLQEALTIGRYNVGGTGATACSTRGTVGSDHGSIARGYVTIDTANTCSLTLPTSPGYYQTEITFDNVLIGDYLRVDPRVAQGNFAGGTPMVHIRAMPGDEDTLQGGATNFPYTFYDRYTPTADRRADRRQPLPGVFAARYIDRSGAADDMAFDTKFLIWREGITRALSCSMSANSALPVARVVRFDESENPTFNVGSDCPVSPCPPTVTFGWPEASARRINSANGIPADYPQTDDAGGWVYFNLNHGYTPAQFTTAVGSNLTNRFGFGTAARSSSQNWVVVEMTAEGRYGVDFDAAYLGNGCSPNPYRGDAGFDELGPLPNFNPGPTVP